jgi:hypothetical protein
VIAFLVDKRPLPPERARILRGWVHSGFNVHRGRRVLGRNFEVFTPWDFIAAITQHIPDKSFQLVRYYEWYSNKMRGRRAK